MSRNLFNPLYSNLPLLEALANSEFFDRTSIPSSLRTRPISAGCCSRWCWRCVHFHIFSVRCHSSSQASNRPGCSALSPRQLLQLCPPNSFIANKRRGGRFDRQNEQWEATSKSSDPSIRQRTCPSSRLKEALQISWMGTNFWREVPTSIV
jgi:hypothetical protein